MSTIPTSRGRRTLKSPVSWDMFTVWRKPDIRGVDLFDQIENASVEY